MAEISQHWKQQFWEVIWLVQDHTAILLPNRTNTQVLISRQSALSPMVVMTFPLPPFALSLLTFCSSGWGQRTSPGPGVPLLKFILLGITDHWDMSVTLSLVFLPIYVVSLLGNMGMVLLICMDTQVHTTMYFFLGNLSLLDACYSSAIGPNVKWEKAPGKS